MTVMDILELRLIKQPTPKEIFTDLTIQGAPFSENVPLKIVCTKPLLPLTAV